MNIFLGILAFLFGAVSVVALELFLIYLLIFKINKQ